MFLDKQILEQQEVVVHSYQVGLFRVVQSQKLLYLFFQLFLELFNDVGFIRIHNLSRIVFIFGFSIKDSPVFHQSA